MKRKREQNGDIAVYFDLSNRFESARALFRHIVDSVAASISEGTQTLISDIDRQRKDIRVEPNVEYDRHLRLILKAVGDRRIIIIFDEIDSLVSVAYSDMVFAQIRS